MLPFKVVYHPRYDLDLGAHVFPSQKFKMVHDALLEEGLADEGDFVEPQPATDEDVLRVHTPAYVGKLQTDSLTLSERMKLEIPVSESTVQAFWLAAGGSILAGRHAVSVSCVSMERSSNSVRHGEVTARNPCHRSFVRSRSEADGCL